jgi:hypothetical protein
LSSRSRRDEEAGKGTCQRDGAGTDESNAITRHSAQAGCRCEWQQQSHADRRTDLGRRVQYAGGDTAIFRIGRICSGLGRGHRSDAEAGAHHCKRREQLSHGQTFGRQGKQRGDSTGDAAEACQHRKPSAQPFQQPWACQ